eukprot:6206072-Prymnesium_polylepis.1
MYDERLRLVWAVDRGCWCAAGLRCRVLSPRVTERMAVVHSCRACVSEGGWSYGSRRRVCLPRCEPPGKPLSMSSMAVPRSLDNTRGHNITF